MKLMTKPNGNHYTVELTETNADFCLPNLLILLCSTYLTYNYLLLNLPQLKWITDWILESTSYNDIVPIIMFIFKCYLSRELIALSLKKISEHKIKKPKEH